MTEDFSTIKDIIENDLSANPKYKFALKCSTLFSFWEEIVGFKFAKFTRPTSIKFEKLYVECKNSAITQELTMFQKKIIEKIMVYAAPLGIKVSDIVFSYKNWKTNEEFFDENEDTDFVEYTEEEILAQEIPKADEKIVFESIEKMEFLTPELKEKYYMDIIKSLKAEVLRKKH